MANHTVKQGNCIESIAFEKGLFWETVWNDSQNAELKRKRKNPNALFPGDKVFVPEKREKEVSGATEKIHRFRRKGVPSRIHVVVKKEGKPRSNEPYTLEIDGELFSGTTNAQGEVKRPILPNAKLARLIVGEGDAAEKFELKLGYVNPITEVSGVQHRLNNLGFHCGQPDGKMSPRTIEAIEAFQEMAGLPVTGEIDQATRDALESKHGS
jgi:hypothetical protein